MKELMFALSLVLLTAGPAASQDFPSVEIFGGYSLQRSDLASRDFFRFDQYNVQMAAIVEGEGLTAGYDTSGFLKMGFQGSVTFNVNKFFGIETSARYNRGDISTLNMNFSGEGEFDASMKGKLSGFAFLAGPHLAFRKNETVTPFAHVLFGMDRTKISNVLEVAGNVSSYDSFVDDLDVKYGGILHHSDWGGSEISDTGFDMVLGGGVDVNVNSFMAIRLIQADYLMSKHYNVTLNNLDLSFGAVFFLGK